jgi:hypothetical protein
MKNNLMDVLEDTEKEIEEYLTRQVKKLGWLEIKLLKNGFSDRMIIHPHGVAFVELKKGKEGRKRLSQIAWEKSLTSLGHKYHLIRSKKEVKELLGKLCLDMKI